MPDLGDIATATLRVTPFSGTTAAALLVTAPDATTSSPATSTADSGNTWTATITYSQVGWWRLKWTVTGTGAGVEYQEVYVSAAPSTAASERVVVPLERFKRWLRYGTGVADDEKLLDHLVAATEWVEWRIGGPIEVTSITESAHTNGVSIIPLKRPLVTVTSITPEESATAIAATAYKVDTTHHLIRFYRGVSPGWYTLVYTAGLASAPRLVRNAGMELARHLWLTQNGSVGRGRTDDDIPVPMGFAVPRRVDEMLAPLTLPGIA